MAGLFPLSKIQIREGFKKETWQKNSFSEWNRFVESGGKKMGRIPRASQNNVIQLRLG